jgi:hypothetical protein
MACSREFSALKFCAVLRKSVSLWRAIAFA